MDLRVAFTDKSLHGDAPIKVNCFQPDHLDDTASLAIYPDHLHCYGCGWHLSGRAAAHAIAEACGVPLTELLDAPTPTPGDSGLRAAANNLSSLRRRHGSSNNAPGASLTGDDLRANPLSYDELSDVWYHLRHDHSDRQEWLKARGLSEAAIDAADLGHDGWRFVIPVRARDGKLLTLRYRVDPERIAANYNGPKYLGFKGRNGLLLYGEHWVDPETDWLVLCEGELDALRLWQEALPGVEAQSLIEVTARYTSIVRFPSGHFPAVSATNGARQMEKLIGLIRDLFPKVRHVVIASDQDKAGHEAARDTALALQRAGYTWERALWDTGKDVTEYLQSGGSPALFMPHPERRNNMADIIVHLAHYLAS